MSHVGAGRDLVIGDIHGHLHALDELLTIVSPTTIDRLIFLGDYVDKGPDTKGVIERLLEFSASHDCVFLRGNHDQMMVDAYRDPTKFPIWECLGGKDPLRSYGNGTLRELLFQVPASHWEFLEFRCRDYFVTPEYILVHGGIRPDVEPGDEEQERLLWSTLSVALPHGSGKTVICGHSAQRTGEIADLGHTICVDTAITHDGWLTCLELGTLQYWQANSRGELRSGILRAKELGQVQRCGD